VIAECVNRNPAHFRIFSTEIVFRDEGLDFVAHGLVDGHLSSDCRTACSFGTTSCFEQRTAISTFNTTQFSSTLAFGKRPVQPSLSGFERRSLLAGYLRARTSNLTRRQSTATATA
jgi:hypothetical protein